jgi:hypothetical protein
MLLEGRTYAGEAPSPRWEWGWGVFGGNGIWGDGSGWGSERHVRKINKLLGGGVAPEPACANGRAISEPFQCLDSPSHRGGGQR